MTRLEQIVARASRYAETKRGPNTVAFVSVDDGLRIEATDGAHTSGAVMAFSEMKGEAGVARACEIVERALFNVKDAARRQGSLTYGRG